MQQAEAGAATEQSAGVEVISRRELQNCPQWQRAFASQHKDSRYYEIVEDTIHPEFHYLYFAVRDYRVLTATKISLLIATNPQGASFRITSSKSRVKPGAAEWAA